MAIGTTIRQLRKERGLTLNQMAALIESDVGNLSRLERGVQGFSEGMLAKVAGALEVPVATLFMLDEAHAAGREVGPEELRNLLSKLPVGPFVGVTAVPIAQEGDPRLIKIPLVRLRLQAGITNIQVDHEPEDGGTTSVSRDWIEKNRFSASKLVAIKVRGDSMEPTLYEDDLVIINTADKKPADGAVFAVNYEGEAVVKRFSRDAGDWWLTSDSPDQRKHHRKICRGEACIIIGRVVRKESDRI